LTQDFSKLAFNWWCKYVYEWGLMEPLESISGTTWGAGTTVWEPLQQTIVSEQCISKINQKTCNTEGCLFCGNLRFILLLSSYVLVVHQSGRFPKFLSNYFKNFLFPSHSALAIISDYYKVVRTRQKFSHYIFHTSKYYSKDVSNSSYNMGQ
jgi:hypothetical protein